MLNDEIKEILLTQEQLNQKTKQLANAISQDYEGQQIIIISILKGGAVFAVDLMRHIKVPTQIDFMSVSSYGTSTTTSGVVKIIKDIDIDIKGKNVIVVEDIVDTGLTLKYLKELLLARDPKSLKICTILDKPSRRKTDLEIDYTGFHIPDEFAVGYGLDYAEKYRNLPFVGVLKRRNI